MIDSPPIPSPRYGSEIAPQVLDYLSGNMGGSYTETTDGCPLGLIPFGEGEASLTLYFPQRRHGKNKRKDYQIKVRYPAFEDPQFSYIFPIFLSQAKDGLNKSTRGPSLWERDLGTVLKHLKSLHWDSFNKCIVDTRE